MIAFNEFLISITDERHIHFAREIELLFEQATSEKSIGLTLKSGKYIGKKIIQGEAVIATKQGRLAGICYLRHRDDDNFISISGVVVVPQFRKMGLAKMMINEIFEMARNKYPKAKIFSLTTSPEVMRINSLSGYKPINYSKLSSSDKFWNECSDCPNFHFLKKNNNTRCLCSAMLFNPFSFNIEDEYQLNDQAICESYAS
jgi:N-acetylglutamate synthase-like GNAT family acetyltransferase